MRSYSIVMNDHPGWVTGGVGSLARVIAAADQRPAVATTDGSQLAWCCPDAASRTGLVVFTLPGSAVPDAPGLARALGSLGPVAGCRTRTCGMPWAPRSSGRSSGPVRPGVSTGLFARPTAALSGAAPGGWLFPAPETVLALRETQFAAVGLAFKRRALQSGAAGFLDHGATWAALPAADLVRELQRVHRVGPWTAGAAAADWANDFSVYPCGDLAVRTWAARAAPSAVWPGDEPGFQRYWQQLAGPHLAELTLLTLAWGGNHARTSTQVPADRGCRPVAVS